MKSPHLFVSIFGTACICMGTAATVAKENPLPGTTFLADKDVEKITKRLTEETMSAALRGMEYAVRGSIVIAADEINDELAAGSDKYPFDHIVYTNIGNPHSVGQKPLTWPRQVMALVDLPDEVGVDHPDVTKLFPADAIRRAREIKEGLGGHGSGAYSHSKGVKMFREDIVKFIEQRDGGVPSDPENIFMSNGASAAIEMVLKALIADSTCGVMIPIPQYPIYSATLDLLEGKKVGYFLDEKKVWDLNMVELERSLQEAKDSGINVVGLVLINPGNPTGQVLTKKAVQDVVVFCAKHRLVLLSDEVYQENVYDDTVQFYSAKRAAYDTGLLAEDGDNTNNNGGGGIELASFHSTSKGVFGECGRRGGYMELVGFDSKVKEHLYKLASASLCSTVSGQIMTSLMCRGPNINDESYDNHEREKLEIFNSLKERAKIVEDGLNSIPGFSCQPAQGSMYCFPSIQIPQGAIDMAYDGDDDDDDDDEENNTTTTPDVLYAKSLLQRTGICVVPASGFGQERGRYGFRTTFLPSKDELQRSMKLIHQHHIEFCSKYSSD